MESGFVLKDGLGIFGDFSVEYGIGLVPFAFDGTFGAVGEAVTAAEALRFVDDGFVVDDTDAVVEAVFCAEAASDAEFCVDGGCAAGVHFHFAVFGAASQCRYF